MNAIATAPVVVHVLPPVWGSPSPSPFAIKLLTWLRMARVPHEVRPLQRPPQSKTGKIPYVTLPDGRMLHDSGLIVATLGRERGVDLDAGLDPAARGTGHAVRRMLEEHTYWAGVHDRWLTDAGFEATAAGYFRHLPAVGRAIVPRVLRRRMRGYLYAQGLGRHPPETIADLARADLAALASVLGDREFLLGPPSTVDATATGLLWALSCHPFPSAATDAVRAHPTLLAYLDRMRATYWSDFRWSAEVP